MDDEEQRIKAKARDWLLRLSLGAPTDEDRAQCEDWCAQDPRHAAAYRRFEAIWQDTAKLEELESLITVPAVRSVWWMRIRASVLGHPLRWAAGASLPIAMMGIVLWVLFTPARYATGTAEVRTIHLSDGSVITLGARSSLEVAFARHERRVALLSGVAFFSVVKDTSRPFVVLVGDEEVRDLGTQFEIRRNPKSMRVSVVEGLVEVLKIPGHAGTAMSNKSRDRRVAAKADPLEIARVATGDKTPQIKLALAKSPEAQILSAGQQVTTSFAGDIPNPHALPPGYSTAWRDGRFVYVDTPLKDIIADANRYSNEPIRIADSRIANVRISVTCPSDRIDEMVSALSRSLSLKVERRSDGEIVLVAINPRN